MVLQVNRRLTAPARKTNLDQLRTRLLMDAKHHTDVMVKGRDISFDSEGLVTLRGEGGARYSWNDYAFGQFCANIEVPADFLRRSPSTGPASRKAIVEHWKEAVDGKTFMLRLCNLDTPDEKTGADGYVRAFLTDRFSKFDNLELLDIVEPFVRANDLEVAIGQYTDRSFHLRVLDPRHIDVSITDKPDMHQVGLHLLNSEVGAEVLRGDFLVYRQICTNGLVALFDKKPLFHHKHVGRGIAAHDVRAQMLAALEHMEDYTDATFSRLRALQEQTLPDPLRELRTALKSNRATDEFVNLAFVAYEEEPNPTRFGTIQAITRAAQRLPTVDGRLEMEQLAGRLLMAA